ncbi:MAG TPA: hypothetical protein PLV68_00280, partial [Ilumatobacteraceae bacterium]|nr:hypothetical protein [Ilumatobacteraceae bacterium]
MALGVGEPEHGTPRRASDDPAVDAEMATDGLDVGDMAVHVDRRPVERGIGRRRRAASRPALVERDRPVQCRVTQIEMPATEPAAWTTVQPHHRHTCRISGLFHMQPMAFT